MNPFVIFFKPLFTVLTWITTGFVAIIMALGGQFDGRPRTQGHPNLVAFFTPAEGAQPPTLQILLGETERFRTIIVEDPSPLIPVSDDVLAVLGAPRRDAVSTLVQLRSDRDRIMVCRLSYDPIDMEPAGVCAIGSSLVYDIIFVDRSDVEPDLPQI